MTSFSLNYQLSTLNFPTAAWLGWTQMVQIRKLHSASTSTQSCPCSAMTFLGMGGNLAARIIRVAVS